MTEQDRELDVLRGVSCAVLLERLPPPWALDRQESTRRALKYRRGKGEVLIINHDGRGWWDPMSECKGDVFDLVQHLEPGAHFGRVRQVLRSFVGLSPCYPEAQRPRERTQPLVPVAERWMRRRSLRPGSAAWDYLAGERRLPPSVLAEACRQDAVREGPYGSAWFAHRDAGGTLTGFEMRGPDYRRFSAGGDKAVFRFKGGAGPLPRLAVCEAPIDALSLAALEGVRRDTLYLATGGGIGPLTVTVLREMLQPAAAPDAVLVAATDADAPGDRLADRLEEIAAAAGTGYGRLRPPDGCKDCNDALKAGRGLA